MRSTAVGVPIRRSRVSQKANEDLLQLHVGVAHDGCAVPHIHNAREHLQPTHKSQERLQGRRLARRASTRRSIHDQADRPEHIRHLPVRAMQGIREVQPRAQDRVLQRSPVPVVFIEQNLPLHCINHIFQLKRKFFCGPFFSD